MLCFTIYGCRQVWDNLYDLCCITQDISTNDYQACEMAMPNWTQLTFAVLYQCCRWRQNVTTQWWLIIPRRWIERLWRYRRATKATRLVNRLAKSRRGQSLAVAFCVLSVHTRCLKDSRTFSAVDDQTNSCCPSAALQIPWHRAGNHHVGSARQLAADFLCFDIECLPTVHCCNSTQLRM